MNIRFTAIKQNEVHEGSKEHLEANHYHYSSKARIYCDHAWRNKEAELIHQLLLTFAD